LLEDFPVLEDLPDMKELSKLKQEISNRYEEYRKRLGSIIDIIRGWRWNDPVSTRYGQLFTNSVVFDPAFKEEDIKKEERRRLELRIPP
jgi:hypothetical protein